MAISLEVMPEVGAPQVGITLDGLSSPATVRVDRSTDGGMTWKGVRGAAPLTAAGSAFLRDHEAPLNIATDYRVVVESGSITGVDQATITVPSVTAWIQDPLAPRGAVAVQVHPVLSNGAATLTGAALGQAVWPQVVDEATVQGAMYPVASIGARSRAASVPLELAALAAEGAALRRMLLSSGQLILRGTGSTLLDPVAHLVLGDVTEAQYEYGQVSTFAATARQVRPTSLRIVVPWFTYDDVRAIVQAALGVGATYNDVLAAMPPGTTYVDAQKDPSILAGGL